MPYCIKYLDDGGVIYRFAGVVTNAELVEADDFAYNSTTHPIKEITYILADFTRADGLNIKIQDVKKISKADSEIFTKYPNLLHATVATLDSVFGLTRIWYGFLGEAQDRAWIFRNHEDAENWIQMKLKKV